LAVKVKSSTPGAWRSPPPEIALLEDPAALALIMRDGKTPLAALPT
jgi:hypothetical protein